MEWLAVEMEMMMMSVKVNGNGDDDCDERGVYGCGSFMMMMMIVMAIAVIELVSMIEKELGQWSQKMYYQVDAHPLPVSMIFIFPSPHPSYLPLQPTRFFSDGLRHHHPALLHLHQGAGR